MLPLVFDILHLEKSCNFIQVFVFYLLFEINNPLCGYTTFYIIIHFSIFGYGE